jgi:hypothetical protein
MPYENVNVARMREGTQEHMFASVALISKFAPEMPQGFANLGIGTRKQISVELIQCLPAPQCHPRVHLLRIKVLLRKGWIAGSSPAMTVETKAPLFRIHRSGLQRGDSA